MTDPAVPDDLQAAVAALWRACGQTPPEGEALIRATANFISALAGGRRVPRLSDKTIQPLAGARPDIENAI